MYQVKSMCTIFMKLYCLQDYECAKFRGLRAIVGLVGLMPPCHRVFLCISWVQNIFSWVFYRFKIFCHGNFVGLRGFFVGISRVAYFFLWMFCGSKIFSRGSQVFSRWYFMGLNFFLVGISWLFQDFSREYFVGQNFFLVVISWARNFFSRIQNFLSWVIS